MLRTYGSYHKKCNRILHTQYKLIKIKKSTLQNQSVVCSFVYSLILVKFETCFFASAFPYKFNFL